MLTDYSHLQRFNRLLRKTRSTSFISLTQSYTTHSHITSSRYRLALLHNTRCQPSCHQSNITLHNAPSRCHSLRPHAVAHHVVKLTQLYTTRHGDVAHHALALTKLQTTCHSTVTQLSVTMSQFNFIS